MSAESVNKPHSIGQLLPEFSLPEKVAGLQVSGLSIDSRRVRPGDIFVAVCGSQLDGEQFIASAIDRGAVAILAALPPSALVQLDKEEFLVEWFDEIPLLRIDKLTERLGMIAAGFYDGVVDTLSITGITGTNGKTTCCQLLGELKHQLGCKAGTIGTLGCGVVGGSTIDTGLTTPDVITVHSSIAHMAAQGAKDIVMEVSSHSLVQGRSNGIGFDTVVFTNLTRDHLDYHGSMEAYSNAKRRLFQVKGIKRAIVNVDDPFGRLLIEEMKPSAIEIFTVGIEGKADISAREIEFHGNGISARVISPWGEAVLSSCLWGRFNLYNLLTVIAVVCAQGKDFSQVMELVAKLKPVVGRMELVPDGGDLSVIVDYAHTPDALNQSLAAARQHCRGKLWCVFGCGGDRDRGKRPLMAEIASQAADSVVVTSDNPRGEDPAAIIADVVTGLKTKEDHGYGVSINDVHILADRSEAIRQAIIGAQTGDCVLVAGKGHENYQVIEGERIFFSDVQQCKAAMDLRAGKGRGG